MTLMPVSNICALRLELVERRRVAVDLPPVVDAGDLGFGDVERLADHVPHVAERAVTDRHGDAVAECCARPRRASDRRWA